jgi:ParB family chromosome partitioning protein
MSTRGPQPIELIPISRITVLNPRARNKRQHREIVNNIEMIGLKRPITVSRRDGPNGPRYDLVCGEGRLEAFQMLGQTEIPAMVIEASESECLVMSLVENIARRVQRPIDVMREVGALRSRGYSEAEIARKIGVVSSWVSMVVSLLERGEERLVAAVETGLIPISLAMEISRAESEEAQGLLLDAYETGKLRGKKLAAVRRLLDLRMRGRNQSMSAGRLGRKSSNRKLTANDLMQVYQREAEKQRLLVKKSDFTCGSAWKKDPVSGVIGAQKEPLISVV